MKRKCAGVFYGTDREYHWHYEPKSKYGDYSCLIVRQGNSIIGLVHGKMANAILNVLYPEYRDHDDQRNER